ncbi:MAG: SMC family ATPase [Crenarchaeota archaeon]|nr:SMC family ATPase [Thermoproteota archaeon]MCR8455669.1 SMC family ATPase [Thermoproteota archaeon]MCR8501558.1 SMC family ATPase [Thermoproteota archaeon]
MRLLRLSCENIASYEKETVDFEKYCYPVFVMGKTGAGKTTLFVDALTLALYGVAYGEGSRGLVKEFIRKGKSTAAVELEFEIEDNRYKLERIIKKEGGSSAKLYVVGKGSPVAVGTKAVDEELERLLGLGFRALLNSVVVRQGEVFEFLEMERSERRELLQKILRIDFKDVLERIEEKLKEVSLKIAEKETIKKRLEDEILREGEVKKKLEDARRRLPSIKVEIDTLEKEKSECEAERTEYHKRLGEVESKIKDLEAKKRSFEDLRQKIKGLEEEIKAIRRELQKYPEEVLKNIEQFKTRILSMYELELKTKDLKVKVDAYKEKLQDYRRMLEILKQLEEAEKHQEYYERLKSELEKYQLRESEIKANIKYLNDILGMLETAEECPVCGSPLPPERKRDRAQHLQNELTELQEELKQVYEELNRLNTERRKLEEQIRQTAELKGVYNELKSRLGDITPKVDEYESLVKLLKELKEDRERLKNEILETFKVDVDAIEIHNLLAEVDKLTASLEELKSKDNALKFYEEQSKELEKELAGFSELINERDQLENKVKKLTGHVESLNRKIQELMIERGKLEELIKNCEEELSRIAERRKELENIKKELENLKIDELACEVLRGKVFKPGALPTELLREYLKFIEEKANEYLETFGQNIRVKLDVVEDRGTRSVELSAYMDDYKRDIKTFSGGERTLIGFAIRLAIGELITQIFSITRRPKFLIIDEGFGMLDEENRELVANAIVRLQEEGIYEQIIVISHQQDLREHPAFRTIIEISKDSQNVSRISRIHPGE